MTAKKKLFWQRLFHLYPYEIESDVKFSGAGKSAPFDPAYSGPTALEFVSFLMVSLLLCFLVFYSYCLLIQAFELLSVGKTCTFVKRCIVLHKQPFTSATIFIGAVIFGVIPSIVIAFSVFINCVKAVKSEIGQ